MYEDRWKDREVNKIYHKIQKHTDGWSRCGKENVEWKVLAFHSTFNTGWAEEKRQRIISLKKQEETRLQRKNGR